MIRKAKIIITIAVAVAALIGIGWHFYTRIQANRPLPAFHFESQGNDGWVGSDNVNVQAVARSTNYTGEEPIEHLPIADLTVHHRAGKSASKDNCFLMYAYYDRPLADTERAYQEYVDKKSADGTVAAHASKDATIATFEGEKSYQLRQYNYIIDSSDALQGYQIGFVPLASGHIRIEGVCKTAIDLDLTLPALASVRLNDR